jgi:diacylglycerol kinase family enzyme
VNELAADAGTQLAGHFWTTFPEPLRGHQRFAQLRALEMTERRARDLAAELARETVTEWGRFREQR